MKNPNLGARLLTAVRDMKAIERGELAPGRVWEVTRDETGAIVRRQVDPEKYRKERESEQNLAASVRSQLGLSQSEFALLIGVPLTTLQGWEQGRREPSGSARVLLGIASKKPEAFLELVRG